VRAALTLAGLRHQARTKFTRADQMWFDRTRLEQSTQELVARHKAQRFARCSDQTVLDLCCGLGADALAIAEQARVLAVDASPLATWYTRQNAAVYEVAERVGTLVSPAESVEVTGRFVHLDPDRRTNGQRQVFGGKFAGCEIELISVQGECKEATIWFGALRDPAPFRATVLPSGATIAGDPWDYRPRVTPLGPYLFDPDPAVVRAGLVDCLAESIGLTRIDDAEEYLTGDQPVRSPFVRGFEVLADLTNNPTEIRDYFRKSSFGQVEIKCRHIRVDADAVRRKLPLPGKEPGVLLFVRAAGKARAIVARRLPVAE
jgi:SAM-dependent methyltransferase